MPEIGPDANLNRVSTAILYTAIAGAPLPFGSTTPLMIAFWCGLLGLGVAAAAPHHLSKAHRVILGSLFLLGAAWLFVVREQLAQHPLLANVHPVWAQASEVLGSSLEPSASIARGQPWFALGASMADMLALMLGLVIGSDPTRARRTLVVMAWAGAAYALYGILSLVIDPTALLWREKQAYAGNLTATFVNRNTAAAYFGSCMVVWLLLLSMWVRRHLSPGKFDAAAVVSAIATRPIDSSVLICGFLLCVTAMFLTGSRAGIALSLISMSIALAVELSRRLQKRRRLWTAFIASGVTALALLEFLGGSVNDRFSSQGLVDNGRFESYRGILQMIADHPWFGSGLGTFRWAFPAYRSANVSLWGVWDIAHSTPLEIAAEVGIPLAAAVAFGWAAIFVVLVRGIRIRKRDRIIPLAAFSVAFIAVLHSLVDFSLQIPGYSIVVCAVVGAGLAQSFRSKRPSAEPSADAAALSSTFDLNDACSKVSIRCTNAT